MLATACAIGIPVSVHGDSRRHGNSHVGMPVQAAIAEDVEAQRRAKISKARQSETRQLIASSKKDENKAAHKAAELFNTNRYTVATDNKLSEPRNEHDISDSSGILNRPKISDGSGGTLKASCRMVFDTEMYLKCHVPGVRAYYLGWRPAWTCISLRNPAESQRVLK